MLDDATIAVIEQKLTGIASVIDTTMNPYTSLSHKSYCQGIAFVLDKLGYYVDWVDEIKVGVDGAVKIAKIKKVEE